MTEVQALFTCFALFPVGNSGYPYQQMVVLRYWAYDNEPIFQDLDEPTPLQVWFEGVSTRELVTVRECCSVKLLPRKIARNERSSPFRICVCMRVVRCTYIRQFDFHNMEIERQSILLYSGIHPIRKKHPVQSS